LATASQRDDRIIATMKKVLIVAAVAEAATGSALLIVPSLVGQLLLGHELTGIAIPVAPVAGMGLIGLGIACWPGPPLAGMLAYSVAVTLYLAYVGFVDGLIGIFLWPAVVQLELEAAGLRRCRADNRGEMRRRNLSAIGP
jgi:hypothetical protein